jgi:hypothetical protein
MLKFYFLCLSLFTSTYGMAESLTPPTLSTKLELYLQEIVQLSGNNSITTAEFKNYFPSVFLTPVGVYNLIVSVSWFLGYKNNDKEFLEHWLNNYKSSSDIFQLINRLNEAFEIENLPKYLKKHPNILRNLLAIISQAYVDHKENYPDIEEYTFQVIRDIAPNNKYGSSLVYKDYLLYTLAKVHDQRDLIKKVISLIMNGPEPRTDSYKFLRKEGLLYIRSLSLMEKYPEILEAFESMNAINQVEASLNILTSYNLYQYSPEEKRNVDDINSVVSKLSKALEPYQNTEIESGETMNQVLLSIYNEFLQEYEKNPNSLSKISSDTNTRLCGIFNWLKNKIYLTLPKDEIISFERDMSLHIMDEVLANNPLEDNSIIQKISELFKAVLEIPSDNASK